MLLLCSGSIRLQWCLDSRKRSTNRTEWCRNGQKAPLEFLKLIFSLPYFTPPFRSSPHQHRSTFSALPVKRPRRCSTNFSHLFIPAIWPFPKSTLSQRGEAFSHWLLLHSNFSLPCSSFGFFHKSFCLSFHFISIYPWLCCLSFYLHPYCPWSFSMLPSCLSPISRKYYFPHMSIHIYCVVLKKNVMGSCHKMDLTIWGFSCWTTWDKRLFQARYISQSARAPSWNPYIFLFYFLGNL